MRIKHVVWCAALMAIATARVGAMLTSEVRGVVLDPNGSPVKAALVTLHSKASDYSPTDKTDDDGAFIFIGLASGEYTVSVEAAGFVKAEKLVRVVSGSSPEIRFQLEIAAIKENVQVAPTPEDVGAETPTPTTLISKEQIRTTPGAARSGSVRVITSYVPGSYLVHNILHVHGGHQVTWLVDGVPIPNTNTGVDVGTPFYINDIDYLEAQRGSYSVEYGDRTYGIFGIVPRTGLGSNKEGELALIYGNFNLTDNYLSFADHTKRLAYYTSLHGFRTDYGLATPGPEVLHDKGSGVGGFASLIFGPSQANQFRLNTSFERDDYQVPNDPEAQNAGVRDSSRQRDAFVFLTWVHTAGPHFVLTVSPFYHFTGGQFLGGPEDKPLVQRHDRSSHYGGLHVVATAATSRHSLKFGFYGYFERDSNFFGLRSTDDPGLSLSQRVRTDGNMEAFFVGDQYRPNEWLSITGGVRFTRFKGAVGEHAVDPRVGGTIRLPRLNWVLHGFYGRYYQEPPLSTVSGPLLEFAETTGFSVLPLRGERDEEYQFGVTVPYKKWWLDTEYYHTRAKNFLDHSALGASNIFFPVTVERARIRGVDVSLTSPRLWGRFRLSLIYAHMRVEGQGGITGGLTDFSFSPGFFFLDHDQRDTLTAGSFLSLPWDSYIFNELHYGSGFTDEGGPTHLPGHWRLDLGGGKKFGKNWSVTVNALNVTRGSYLLDNSPLLGGTHWVEPRQVWAELRYHFHY
ncbi:MAG TPA: TonB-dependent receptor [Pyrinomonadaceae bacterium]|nr:TonB-dependent receptor [Pyrinomonadaceae bacterium]